MLDRIVEWSIRWRVLVIVLTMGLVVAGIYAAAELPIDAVPDVTSNQVQINAVAPAFTPQEMEQYVTFPIEVAMSSLPYKEAVRSISQFGLSQVTVVFGDETDIYRARQLVLERLIDVQRDLPAGVAPELAPVSTGLGEIYQFTVDDVTGRASLFTHGSSNDSGLVHQATATDRAGRDRGQQLWRSRAAVRSTGRSGEAGGISGSRFGR